MRRAVLAAVVALSLVATASGDKNKGDNPDDEVDYLALAARLVRDGHYDRAELALQKVNLDDETVDKQRYYILAGLVSMQNKVYVDAAENFERAIEAGATDPVVYVSLGQARFGMKDYRGAVTALQRAGEAARSDPRAELLLSRSYWELGDPGAALDVIGRAGARFPASIDFPRFEMFYLVELGLFQELSRRSSRFLARDDLQASDLAAVGEALRKTGELEDAELFLEAARLRFPDDTDLAVLQARVLMDQGSLLSSAMVLEQVARMDPKYLIEAAEMYRRAGRLERALFINQRVGDQKAKMKQRLQILLELGRFETISAMEARLSRLGLLEDEQIRYALAYGFFMIRDFESAERHIKHLRDPDLFAKGIELRKAIASCKAAGWMCQ